MYSAYMQVPRVTLGDILIYKNIRNGRTGLNNDNVTYDQEKVEFGVIYKL